MEASSTSALPQLGESIAPNERQMPQMKEVFLGASRDVENSAYGYPPRAHVHPKSS